MGRGSCSFPVCYLRTVDQIGGVAAPAQSVISTLFPHWAGLRARAELFFRLKPTEYQPSTGSHLHLCGQRTFQYKAAFLA